MYICIYISYIYIYFILYHVMLCYSISYYIIMIYHSISHYTISYYIISYDIISCHVMPYHIILHYITLHYITYRRRKIYCIDLITHAPCIPVSMLALDLTAGGVMNRRVEDGVLERTQHWNGDTKGYPIIYAIFRLQYVYTLGGKYIA